MISLRLQEGKKPQAVTKTMKEYKKEDILCFEAAKIINLIIQAKPQMAPYA